MTKTSANSCKNQKIVFWFLALNDICLTLLWINSKELTWNEIFEGEMKGFVGDFMLQQKQAKTIPFLLTEAFCFCFIHPITWKLTWFSPFFVSPLMILEEVANLGCLDLMSVWIWMQRQSWSSLFGVRSLFICWCFSRMLLPYECLCQGQTKNSPISWVGEEEQLSKAENSVPDQLRSLLWHTSAVQAVPFVLRSFTLSQTLLHSHYPWAFLTHHSPVAPTKSHFVCFW